MSTSDNDNDILLSLFANLRNAATSFGTDSYQYENVFATVRAHLNEMKAKGKKTDLTGAKEIQKDDTNALTEAFQSLDLELKSGDRMEE